MKKFILYFVIVITLLWSCTSNSVNQRHVYAMDMIKKIETYNKVNRVFPETVFEIGLSEHIDSLAFYKKTKETEYIVWYGMSLGESNIYNSSTKQWTATP